MALSVIPARLEYACGHASLVTLPAFRGEGSRMRSQRVEAEKAAAALRPCDFCPPSGSAVLSTDEVLTLAATPSPNGANVPAPEREAPAPAQGAVVEPTPATPPAEPTDTVAAPSPEDHPVTAPRRRGAKPKLSSDQVQELLHLYAGTTPPRDIARQFGIAESSIYRFARIHGVTRTRKPTAVKTAPSSVDAVTVAAPAPTPALQNESTRRRSETRPPRRAPSPRSATKYSPRPRARATPDQVHTSIRQFRVHFQADLVLQARDIQDALRQAEARGADEITRITRTE